MKKSATFASVALLACCSPLGRSSQPALMLLPPWPAAAEVTESGYMLGSPLGFTHAGHGQIEMHWPGFTNGGGAPATTAHPDFAAFMTSAFDTDAAQSPILAMSMGLESITITDPFPLPADAELDGSTTAPSDRLALLLPGSHGWVALEFTVNRAELPTPLPPDLAPDIAAADSNGVVDATVFSLVVPGSDSEMLPNEFESVQSVKPASMGLTSKNELHAIDLHAALFCTDLSLYTAIFSSRTPAQDACIYFTLRPEYVAKNGVALKTRWNLPANADSATIFMSRWVNNAWETPRVYQTAASLHIPTQPNSTPPRDVQGNILSIDGLAINARTPGVVGRDEILFSLAANNDSAANQFRFTVVQDPAPPRRVIAPKRGGGYGSLGLMTRAGAAHGDFCQLDPLLQHVYKSFATVLKDQHVLDDFAIARRLRPDGSSVPPRNGQLAPGPAGIATVKRWPAITGDLPGSPAEALAVASYRWTRRATPDRHAAIMRTCMSWPGQPANVPVEAPAQTHGNPVGRAWVRHGEITDLARYCADPSSVPITWRISEPVDYAGAPLSLDLDLPANGLLQPPPNHGTPGTDAFRAYAAQWYLEVDGALYTSPLSVLRY